MTNYTDLRTLGIQYLEQMNGGTWTDFNAHDPGITLLESLCYALTDLDYRTEHELVDLLADGGSNPHDSLHHPAQLLTTHAVTHDDLRRILLDVVGVKNAWIENVDERLDNQQPLVGLYRIVIEASPEREGVLIRRDIGRRLHKNRGLCEDFTDIVILDPLHISVDAKIEIGRVDNPATTYAAILDAISENISPTIRMSSTAERMATGLPIDEIFNGPLLEHGFITNEAMAEPRHRAIHVSDIVHAAMNVPGVRSVTGVVLRAGDIRDVWSLDVPLDRTPRLDRVRSQIQLLNAGLPVAMGKIPPEPPFPKRTPIGPDAGIELPTGRNRNVSRYHSVQHHLPMIYGIGEAGLSDNESVERKALAKQLKAFLMFFDQLLANHLAQLAHVKDLFSIHAATSDERTYFTQIVDEPGLDLESIAKATPNILAALAESPTDALARKDRFLNHLLARFGEHLNDRYSAAADNTDNINNTADDNAQLIQQKQTFLKQYPRISGSRGTAFDALGPWGKANPSGLEDRIRFKLGLDETKGEGMDMIEHILTRPGQRHLFDEFLPHLPKGLRDQYSLRITFVFPGNKGRFPRPAFRQVVERTLRTQTPAHIGTYVLWLDDDPWETFHQKHIEWRRARREHVASKLGISLGLDPRLLTYVDNLLDLPGLTATTITSPRVADYGQTARILVHGSQEGHAAYSLVRNGNVTLPSKNLLSNEAVIGTGKTISIESRPLLEDEVIRVQVERLFDDPIWLEAALPVRVRANPALAVSAAGNTSLRAPQATIDVEVKNSQASVFYRAFTHLLKDEDIFFVAQSDKDILASVPAQAGIAPSWTVYVAPPPDRAWTSADYVANAAAKQGNGGALVIDGGPMVEDTLVIVQAHKEHGADPPDATDVQLNQAVLLLKRPGPAAGLTLTKTSNTTIALSGGEPGVFYYLLDPVTNKLLGKPGYFHRQVDATSNRGIGNMRTGHDFAIARGEVASGANRQTTKPLDPVVTVSAIPASNTVKVMAVRGRTGAPWAAMETKLIGT